MKFKKNKNLVKDDSRKDDSRKEDAEKLIASLNNFEELHEGDGSANFSLFITYTLNNLDYDGGNYSKFYYSLINFTGIEAAYTVLMQRPLFNQSGESTLNYSEVYSNENFVNNRYVEFLDGKYEGWSARVKSVTDRLEEIREKEPITNYEKYVFMNRAFVEDILWDLSNERYSLFESWRIEEQVDVMTYLEYLGYISCVLRDDDSSINDSHLKDLAYFYNYLHENTGVDYPLDNRIINTEP